MDVPSPHAGTVQGIEGQGRRSGLAGRPDPDVEHERSRHRRQPQLPDTLSAITLGPRAPSRPQWRTETAAGLEAAVGRPAPLPAGQVHASPSIRRFARELGVDLTRLAGVRPQRTDLQEDVQKPSSRGDDGRNPGGGPAGGVTGGGVLDLLPWPTVDFAKFGPVEAKPLPRIKKISGANLARNWVMIPAVTITRMPTSPIWKPSAFRSTRRTKRPAAQGDHAGLPDQGLRPGAAKFPEFNTSLDGDSLIYKKYFHIAFAADTPNGLVVPVIRTPTGKASSTSPRKPANSPKKARDGKLGPADMQGGCFTISSVGGIGGTAFRRSSTPRKWRFWVSVNRS